MKVGSAIALLWCSVVFYATVSFAQCEVEGWIYFKPNVASPQVWIEIHDGANVVISAPADSQASDHPFSCQILEPSQCAKALAIVPNVSTPPDYMPVTAYVKPPNGTLHNLQIYMKRKANGDAFVSAIQIANAHQAGKVAQLGYAKDLAVTDRQRLEAGRLLAKAFVAKKDYPSARAEFASLYNTTDLTAFGDAVALTYWQEWFDTFMYESHYTELKTPDRDFANYLAAHESTQKDWNTFASAFASTHPQSPPLLDEGGAEKVSQELKIIRTALYGKS